MRLITLALLALFAFPVQAQVAVCNTHEFVKNKLEKEHDEQVIGRGLRGNGIVIEVYYSEKSQTWTIVASDPIMSCVMNDGEYWEIITPKADGTES
jgi:hypothetical protein